MLAPLLAGFAIFAITVFGLAWPLVARLTLDPAEKLCAALLLSLLGVYLFAFGVYLAALPAFVHHALPLLALAGLLGRRAELAATLRAADARILLTSQLLVSVWGVGWLALVTSYSGGSWAGDWFEHWERTRFFIERLPLDTQFLDLYALPARPPLANLVVGAFLGSTAASFPLHQFFLTLLNTLAFLPAALLARRFGRAPAMAVLTVLVMLSPFFVQNATFAWTKLVTAAWVLGGLYFFLRARDPDGPRPAAALCALALAAGILTHYSAAPYALLLFAAWLIWPPRLPPVVPLIFLSVLFTWFGWSLWTYGASGTFLSNSTVTTLAPQPGQQLLGIMLNLRDTLVPHFLRSPDPSLITQSSPWGWWRDWFFLLYQVNLFFIVGGVGWLVLLVELARHWASVAPRTRAFWLSFVAGVVVLGVAVHSGRDPWGLAHICLQPLALLGLVFLAARWPQLARRWRRLLCAGAVVDFFLGIALHFGVQSYLLDHWITPQRTPVEVFLSYSATAMANFRCKFLGKLPFLADVLPFAPALVLALLAAVFILALLRAQRLSTVS